MKTILNLSQWKTRVNDLFSIVTLCKLTHDEMLNRKSMYIDVELNRKWANGRNVYSAFDRGYVSGMFELHIDMLYKNYLEFCYVESDGTLVSTHKQSTHKLTEIYYDANLGYMLNDMKSGHFWRDSNKRFF